MAEKALEIIPALRRLERNLRQCREAANAGARDRGQANDQHVGRGLVAMRRFEAGELIWREAGIPRGRERTFAEVMAIGEPGLTLYKHFMYQTGADSFESLPQFDVLPVEQWVMARPDDPTMFMNHSCDPTVWYPEPRLLPIRHPAGGRARGVDHLRLRHDRDGRRPTMGLRLRLGELSRPCCSHRLAAGGGAAGLFRPCRTACSDADGARRGRLSDHAQPNTEAAPRNARPAHTRSSAATTGEA